MNNQRNPATGVYGPILKLAVTTLELDFSVLESSIGNIQVSALQGLTNSLLPFVKDAINFVGGAGFPLSSLGGMQFVNPQIGFQDSALSILTNVSIAL